MCRFLPILALIVGSVDLLLADSKAEEEATPAGDVVVEEVVVAPKVAGNLDIKNSGDGSFPGGSTPKKGKWAVDAAAKKLNVSVSPLVEGWLEFGPELREKGATVTAIARGPGDGRLQSRFGVGLYGPNGFQLRAVQISDTLQLVRRGEVLDEVKVELKPGEAYHFELSVLEPVEEDGDEWEITSRLWAHETVRPEKPMIRRRLLLDDLLFPLAGRSVIIATPFSGEPVSFLSATSYYGEFVTPDPEDKIEEADTGKGEAAEEEVLE